MLKPQIVDLIWIVI